MEELGVCRREGGGGERERERDRERKRYAPLYQLTPPSLTHSQHAAPWKVDPAKILGEGDLAVGRGRSFGDYFLDGVPVRRAPRVLRVLVPEPDRHLPLVAVLVDSRFPERLVHLVALALGDDLHVRLVREWWNVPGCVGSILGVQENEFNRSLVGRRNNRGVTQHIDEQHNIRLALSRYPL